MKQNHSGMSIIAGLTFIIITILMCGPSIATECIVDAIVDGDTVKCSKQRIRLSDIDAPEKKQKFGAESTRFLANLVNGKKITYNSNKKDMYGRTIARIYCGDIDVSLSLVQHGYAWAYYTKDKTIIEAQRQAKEQRLGLWRDKNAKAPWLYRKGK